MATLARVLKFASLTQFNWLFACADVRCTALHGNFDIQSERRSINCLFQETRFSIGLCLQDKWSMYQVCYISLPCKPCNLIMAIDIPPLICGDKTEHWKLSTSRRPRWKFSDPDELKTVGVTSRKTEIIEAYWIWASTLISCRTINRFAIKRGQYWGFISKFRPTLKTNWL